ncbi:MAG: uroporphyrinogen-III synthase [Methylophilaceae bacterium]|nr:uroporphyrinogen-III synthase [Methylophilaceae bacterium]
MNSTPDHPLAGCGIVITRPQEQAGTLASLVRQAGGIPISFPLLEISPLDDYSVFDRIVDHLDDFDWAIFISSNAVQYGLPRVLSRRSLPPTLQCAALGPMTAAALKEFGIHRVLTPADRFDSESLLNLPELQAVAGQRCVIFRGTGGRDLLAQTLRARGATVEFAECYQRILPHRDAHGLESLWHSGELHAVVVTSSEALRNLLALAGAAAWLRAVPLIVNHPRIAEIAAAHGLHAIAASGPGDTGLLQTLIDWRTSRNQ